MAGPHGGNKAAKLLRKQYEVRLTQAEARHAGREAEDTGRASSFELAAAALNATRAERRRLLELRTDGTIGDDAFHQVEEELDRAELNALVIDPDG